MIFTTQILSPIANYLEYAQNSLALDLFDFSVTGDLSLSPELWRPNYKVTTTFDYDELIGAASTRSIITLSLTDATSSYFGGSSLSKHLLRINSIADDQAMAVGNRDAATAFIDHGLHKDSHKPITFHGCGYSGDLAMVTRSLVTKVAKGAKCACSTVLSFSLSC